MDADEQQNLATTPVPVSDQPTHPICSSHQQPPTSGDDRHGVQASRAPAGGGAAPTGVPPHRRPRVRPLPAPGHRLRCRASQEPHHVRDSDSTLPPFPPSPLSSFAPELYLIRGIRFAVWLAEVGFASVRVLQSVGG